MTTAFAICSRRLTATQCLVLDDDDDREPLQRSFDCYGYLLARKMLIHAYTCILLASAKVKKY